MSTTLANLRARLRVELHEADDRIPSSVVRLDQGIRNAYIALQAKLPSARIYTASAGTISSGSETFSLPVASNEEYDSEISIQLAIDGTFLTRLTVEEINQYRDRTPSNFQSRPRFFATWEDNTQTVQGFCYPRADAAYTYNLFKKLTAADFDLTALDSSTIALSRIGQDALVYKAAALMIAKMTDADREARGIGQNAAAVLDREAGALIYKEAARRHSISGVGRTMRMVY